MLGNVDVTKCVTTTTFYNSNEQSISIKHYLYFVCVKVVAYCTYGFLLFLDLICFLIETKWNISAINSNFKLNWKKKSTKKNHSIYKINNKHFLQKNQLFIFVHFSHFLSQSTILWLYGMGCLPMSNGKYFPRVSIS